MSKGILDVHCHILPWVDDGSRSLEETREMIAVAREIGVERIVATPHLYSLNGDIEGIRESYLRASRECAEAGIELLLGYECNYRALMESGAGALTPHRIAGSNVLLLEPPTQFLPESWESGIIDLQRLGTEVVIAHFERCIPVQRDLSIAERMLELGCELQVSADSLFAGLTSKVRKCAVEMLKGGMVSYIASDAHCPRDYRVYGKALRQYGKFVRPNGMLWNI